MQYATNIFTIAQDLKMSEPEIILNLKNHFERDFKIHIRNTTNRSEFMNILAEFDSDDKINKKKDKSFENNTDTNTLIDQSKNPNKYNSENNKNKKIGDNSTNYTDNNEKTKKQYNSNIRFNTNQNSNASMKEKSTMYNNNNKKYKQVDVNQIDVFTEIHSEDESKNE